MYVLHISSTTGVYVYIKIEISVNHSSLNIFCSNGFI